MEAAATGQVVSQQTIKPLLCVRVRTDCSFSRPSLLPKSQPPDRVPLAWHWALQPFILGVGTSHQIQIHYGETFNTELLLLLTHIFAWPSHLLICVNQVWVYVCAHVCMGVYVYVLLQVQTGCVCICVRASPRVRMCAPVCVCECSHTYLQLVIPLAVPCSFSWSPLQPSGSALLGAWRGVLPRRGGAEDSESSLRPRPAHVAGDQHPPSPVAHPHTCPAPNSRGPQGDP